MLAYHIGHVKGFYQIARFINFNRYGFHLCVKAKTSLQEDDVPIDDTKTKPLFTPQEKGRKSTRDKVPRLRWNPWQKHVKSMSISPQSSLTLQVVPVLHEHPDILIIGHLSPVQRQLE
ncbi:hypothetical protein LAZ67_7002252 [Cordylochernes scorpioides]|uniref:Uncharacterized protein n=1 Tax=Cordylochernes scorpioides TaxID=51811 RepID=A0ABY6KRM4_9ARAC|nr:hypothetical protein LAZ67_7002252 [Cordylochernes scorpioides]